MKAESPDSEFNRLKNWHWKMSAASQPARQYKKEDEGHYFSDIENTRTQLTKTQLEEIKIKYDIPISTKMSYAIIEQMLSMLTGTKPYPKLLASSADPNAEMWTQIYERCFNGVWYESETNEELVMAWRDSLVSGDGYIHVRKSNFWNESSFGVVHEFVPWNYVYVDPNSKKNDYSDAEMMCIAKIISKRKAEAEFDVTIPAEDVISKDNGWGMGVEFGEVDVPYYAWSTDSSADKSGDTYVWTREFYEKKNTFVYIGDGGEISKKRPTQTIIPNDEKIALQGQIQALQAQMDSMAQQGQEVAEQTDQMSNIAVNSQDPQAAVVGAGAGQQATQEAKAQIDQMTEQLQQMMLQHAQMPDEIPAYELIPLTSKNGEAVIVKDYKKIKKKHIIRTFTVGNKIYETELLMSDEYPIIAFNISHNKSPNKVYSITHYIKDIVKALNKFWSITIYDAQLHGQRKVLLEESTVVDLNQWQNEWAVPGAILRWKVNPTINDGGKPIIMEPSPLNQAYTQILVLLQQLAEYITGIFSVLQGNQQPNAPTTMGGIQSMQAAGGQRLKLYSRFFEVGLQKLAYVTVCYLQQYAPRETVLRYFDDNKDGQEVMIMKGGDDIKFKVRVQLTTNLPTTKLMSAQLLSSVSGQTSNPAVADLLTKQMIKNLDMPESDQLLKDIDTVQMLQGQLDQAMQQLDAMTKKLNMMQNNEYSANLSMKQKLAEAEMKQQMDENVRQHEESLEAEDKIPLDF